MKRFTVILMTIMLLISMIGTVSAETSRPLIVYFTVAENTEADAVSGATPMIDEKGALRVLADMIAEKTDGDLFSLQTEHKYNEEYPMAAGFALAENQYNLRPALTEKVDISTYDTVFIGYTAWWYDMPMAIYSFLDDYDLSGKQVYIFNTHAGSGTAGGVQAIIAAEPNANVSQDNFSIWGNENIGNAWDEVNAWLEGLGY